jgi:hypothetical protein
VVANRCGGGGGDREFGRGRVSSRHYYLDSEQVLGLKLQDKGTSTITTSGLFGKPILFENKQIRPPTTACISLAQTPPSRLGLHRPIVKRVKYPTDIRQARYSYRGHDTIQVCAPIGTQRLGMDSQYLPNQELYHIQMDVKHVQAVQINQGERLLRLEKRQADDAALKSVWGTGSPFPGVLSGTPQQG